MKFQQWNSHSMNNYAYTPVLLESESKLLKVEAVLKENNISPRRYFYPSLDALDCLKENPIGASYTKKYSINNDQVCEVSRDIASRILCLPIYPGLSENSQVKICQVLREVSI